MNLRIGSFLTIFPKYPQLFYMHLNTSILSNILVGTLRPSVPTN